MALFKVCRGKRENLPSNKTDGYAYFCTDGSFCVDYTDENGELQRKQLNAKEAELLEGISLSELQSDINSKVNTFDCGDIISHNASEFASANHTHDAIYQDVLKKILAECAYPVGSYYWSSVDTNPADLFGMGIWEQIKDKFIIAAGDSHTVGQQYGNQNINLEHSHSTPNHSHTYGFQVAAYVGEVAVETASWTGALAGGNGNPTGWSIARNGDEATFNSSTVAGSTKYNANRIRSTANTSSNNGGNTGNALSRVDITPLSVAAYCWHRIA